MWSLISCAGIEDLHERCLAQNYNSSGTRPTTYTKETCIKVLFHFIESLSKRLDLSTLKPDRSRVRRTKAPSHTYTTIQTTKWRWSTIWNTLKLTQFFHVLSTKDINDIRWLPQTLTSGLTLPLPAQGRLGMPHSGEPLRPEAQLITAIYYSIPNAHLLNIMTVKNSRLSPIICQIIPLTATQCETSSQ